MGEGYGNLWKSALLKEDVEKVRSSLDPVSYISAYVSLKKRGKSFVGLCPFHTEKTPSFHVTQDGLFYCFGCHKGGDIFRFVELLEGVSFPEAVKKLAEYAGVSLSFSREERGKIGYGRGVELLREVWDLFSEFLWRDPLPQEYLSSRSYPSSFWEGRFGYLPPTFSLKEWGEKKRISSSELLEVGILTSSLKDRFSGRLILPVMDEKGRVRGFGGRTLFGEEPKYINSPDTVWFHKGDLLFGFPYAQEGFLKRKRAILCEGYFDVLRFHLKGFLEAVAPMGTALTLRQAGILSSRVDKVYLAYDRDLSGWRAGLKSFASLLSRGVEVYLFPLQEGKDPDEGLKDRSSEEIEELLSKAPPFWEEVLTFYGKGKESLQEKHRALGELLDLLKEVEDTTFVELALSDLSKVFSISLSSLKDRWEKVSPRKREKRFASEQTLEPLKEEPKGVERILCHLIVKEEIDRFALYRRWESAPLHPWFKALLRGEFLESPLYREFVARLKMTDPPLLRPGGVDTLCEEMERELALRRKKEEVKKLLQTS